MVHVEKLDTHNNPTDLLIKVMSEIKFEYYLNLIKFFRYRVSVEKVEITLINTKLVTNDF